MALTKSMSTENENTDENRVYPEQKGQTKHDTGIPSHLIWRAVIIVVASVLLSILLYNTNLWPKGDRPQTRQDKQQSIFNQEKIKKETNKPVSTSSKDDELKRSQKPVQENFHPSGSLREDKARQKPIEEGSIPSEILTEDKARQMPKEEGSIPSEILTEDKSSQTPMEEGSIPSGSIMEDKASHTPIEEGSIPSETLMEEKARQKPIEKSSITSQTLNKDKGSKKRSQKSKKETSKPTRIPNNGAKKGGAKLGPIAAITNKYDADISKDIKKANNLLEKGKIEDALRRFRSILDRNPKSPRAHYGKAQALDKLSEKRKSNELLQEAIDAYAKVPDVLDCPRELTKLALTRMGERLNFFGRMRQAAQVYEKLWKIFPDDLGIMNELGVQYITYGNNNDAKRIFREVLKIKPNNGFAKSHLGFVLKSELMYEESIPLLREGIHSGEPKADNGRFYFHLGDALGRIGKPQEAYDVYVEAANKGIFLSPLQRSLYNADTPLRARPWWQPKDTGYMDAFRKLESNWKTIREEGLAMMDEKTGGFLPEEENLREKGDWLQFTLYQQGKKIKSNCKKTPKTCAIMDTIPESTGCKRGQVKFSVMHPGTHLWPHTGPTNCRLRAHLGLVIPKSVAIRVAETTRTWEEGKVIVIDDSIEHEVWHNGTSLRLIFIADFWHPDLTLHQKATLSPI